MLMTSSPNGVPFNGRTGANYEGPTAEVLPEDIGLASKAGWTPTEAPVAPVKKPQSLRGIR